MFCTLGDQLTLLDNQNGFLTKNCSTKAFRRAKMGIQHLESYEIKSMVNNESAIQTFRFTSKSFPRNFPKNKCTKLRKSIQRNWSADRKFFEVKSSIEKICLQDRIDHIESLRKIPQLKNEFVKSTNVDFEFDVWRSMIFHHKIVWKRQVLKNSFCPEYESFHEADEFILEPNDNLHLYEEEDCF